MRSEPDFSIETMYFLVYLVQTVPHTNPYVFTVTVRQVLS